MRFSKFDILKLTSLHAQLSHYGLDPFDWKVCRTRKTLRGKDLELQHRRDVDFRFQAQLERTTSGRAYLKNLKLLSI